MRTFEYDTLKKEYNELRIRHDRAYAEKILAEAKRDKCIEALKGLYDECAILMKQIPLNTLIPRHNVAYDRYMDRMIKAELTLKNNSK